MSARIATSSASPTSSPSSRTSAKALLLETYYRHMRGQKPAGGSWNSDVDNRRPLATGASASIVAPRAFSPDRITREVVDVVEQRFPASPGKLDNGICPCMPTPRIGPRFRTLNECPGAAPSRSCRTSWGMVLDRRVARLQRATTFQHLGNDRAREDDAQPPAQLFEPGERPGLVPHRLLSGNRLDAFGSGVHAMSQSLSDIQEIVKR